MRGRACICGLVELVILSLLCLPNLEFPAHSRLRCSFADFFFFFKKNGETRENAPFSESQKPKVKRTYQYLALSSHRFMAF